MAKRNLLLCFDAFGTLFYPKKTIEKQYVDAAQHCLAEQTSRAAAHSSTSAANSLVLTDDAVRVAFQAAFKAQTRGYPNYGKHSGLDAAQWWTNVIHDTFAPLLTPVGLTVPPELAPRLLNQFASSDGYAMLPKLPGLLRGLRTTSCRGNALFDQIAVGIITNSDDRVPGILSSFGLHVGCLRYMVDQPPTTSYREDHSGGRDNVIDDIDFHCMSYDVGFEKPDKRIFEAAETLLAKLVQERARSIDESRSNGAGHVTKAPPVDLAAWDKLYVGDDFAKDVVGAQRAGWWPVFLAGEGEDIEAVACSHSPGRRNRIVFLNNVPKPVSLAELYAQYDIVAIQSVEALLGWLAGEEEGQ